MKLGLLFTGASPITEIVSVGRCAELAGFSSLYMVEAYRSAWVPLMALANATSRVRLGPYVLNGYARSPLLAGMTAVDFNEFSGGRLVLGVGGGNRIINEQWQGIPHARVLSKMTEYVSLLQQIARTHPGDRLDFTGKVHRMQWSPVTDPGPRPFPVYLAAIFPKMLKVAAQIADGIAGGATLSADYLRSEARPAAARYAAEAGRVGDNLCWTAVAFTAVDADRERARRVARAALCHLFAPLPHPYYEFTMREQGFGATVDTLVAAVPSGNMDAAIDAIPDELIDRLTIAGTPAECHARLRAYDGLVDELILCNVLPNATPNQPDAYAALLDLARDAALSTNC